MHNGESSSYIPGLGRPGSGASAVGKGSYWVRWAALLPPGWGQPAAWQPRQLRDSRGGAGTAATPGGAAVPLGHPPQLRDSRGGAETAATPGGPRRGGGARAGGRTRRENSASHWWDVPAGEPGPRF